MTSYSRAGTGMTPILDAAEPNGYSSGDIGDVAKAAFAIFLETLYQVKRGLYGVGNGTGEPLRFAGGSRFKGRWNKHRRRRSSSW
jgi:hypothetical protein